MTKSFLDRLRVGDIKIDEDLWGPGSREQIEFFLQNEYDPEKMPLLAAADVKNREGTWLLGWENDGTAYPPMLVYIFGQEYADARLAEIHLRKQQSAEGEGRFGFGFHRVRP